MCIDKTENKITKIKINTEVFKMKKKLLVVLMSAIACTASISAAPMPEQSNQGIPGQTNQIEREPQSFGSEEAFDFGELHDQNRRPDMSQEMGQRPQMEDNRQRIEPDMRPDEQTQLKRKEDGCAWMDGNNQKPEASQELTQRPEFNSKPSEDNARPEMQQREEKNIPETQQNIDGNTKINAETVPEENAQQNGDKPGMPNEAPSEMKNGREEMKDDGNKIFGKVIKVDGNKVDLETENGTTTYDLSDAKIVAIPSPDKNKDIEKEGARENEANATDKADTTDTTDKTKKDDVSEAPETAKPTDSKSNKGENEERREDGRKFGDGIQKNDRPDNKPEQDNGFDKMDKPGEGMKDMPEMEEKSLNDIKENMQVCLEMDGDDVVAVVIRED